jgi:hypothetical protein
VKTVPDWKSGGRGRVSIERECLCHFLREAQEVCNAI